ncbi:hypothetical protein GCM10029976_046600 [Kribbella albertanoniae]|uniref:Secreted protein n=1 Tax=Kribbella albertanoniae TaxID=1266829 RepID=A0A4R4Q416_9ACTN|nr:hypothetical protein [Kribbella albertanoniae]TDC29798.1 hypothetical protein E1261_14790 [Kribbella albertanoniae]
MTLLSRALGVLAGTALLAIGAVPAATAAPAAEVTPMSASAAAAPTNCVGIATSWGATCFKPAGDNQWVVDKDANGYAVIAHVETGYGKIRECKSLPSADGWGYCDFDHKEGECVRFYMYEQKGNDIGRVSAWSRSYSIADGTECIIIVP